jgi:hypothetical protein
MRRTPRRRMRLPGTGTRGPSGSEMKLIALSFLRLGITAFGGPAALFFPTLPAMLQMVRGATN